MKDDGSKLWLRFGALGESAQRYQRLVRQINVAGNGPTAQVVRHELSTALAGLLQDAVPVGQGGLADGAIVVGTPKTHAAIAGLGWDSDLARAGDEGYVIRSASVDGRAVTIIASQGEIGTLYGAFGFLRLMQTGRPIDRLSIIDRPRLQLRLMNHWDNLDGTIERGYAGRSLWEWDELPGKLSPRYTDYARANASIGINGSVVNNVNASAKILSAQYLKQVAALADVWRPYGIRVYLSANFAAPKTLGGLKTADPFDPGVAAWWKAKADEIYALIPDFGGFLVKANSEGQPGPQDYKRTHADGANVLADAMAPHGGIVMWRAFVYDEGVDPDRAKRAYIEFTELRGKFRPNVIVQVKNGPIDFQPREPFHPLFGAMPETPMFAEVQAAQEYLGQSKHLVYLGTMWKEFLDADTFAKGQGSTVGKVIDGSVQGQKLTGMTCVTNTGSDANWCGHDFSQANWYAFGRLAWDHELPAEHVAEEWIRMTFTSDPSAVDVIRGMMMGSREAFVDYSEPLGLHHFVGGDHYAPVPWNAKEPRDDWTAVYYHRANAKEIGFDRTRRGDKAVEQYFPPVCDLFDDLKTCPEKLLLWFHRVGWDFKMASGRTLWQEMCAKYFSGHEQAVAMAAAWESLAGKIDADRHAAVAKLMVVQVADSAKWRDAILKYFSGINGLPVDE